MSAVVLEERTIIPDGIRDHESFRQWARSTEFPQTGRFAFLSGKIWVDMSPEELMTHNQMKGEYAIVLGSLAKKNRLGRYYHDRNLLTNVAAGLSTEPDGTFVSYRSFRSRRVTLVRGTEGYIEMEGSPDMTLEIIRD